MPEHMREFSPARWETVKSVLSGEHGDKVSMTAAAKAAGITLACLKGWVRQSERRDPTDDPMIHEIAEFMQDTDRLQSDTLEDVMWYRAVDGWDEPIVHQGELTGETVKKFDNKLLLRLLETRSERYRPKTIQEHRHKLDTSEVYERLLAGRRLAEAEREKTIEGKCEIIEDVGLPAEMVTPDKPDVLEDEDDLVDI